MRKQDAEIRHVVCYKYTKSLPNIVQGSGRRPCALYTGLRPVGGRVALARQLAKTVTETLCEETKKSKSPRPDRETRTGSGNIPDETESVASKQAKLVPPRRSDEVQCW